MVLEVCLMQGIVTIATKVELLFVSIVRLARVFKLLTVND